MFQRLWDDHEHRDVSNWNESEQSVSHAEHSASPAVAMAIILSSFWLFYRVFFIDGELFVLHNMTGMVIVLSLAAIFMVIIVWTLRRLYYTRPTRLPEPVEPPELRLAEDDNATEKLASNKNDALARRACQAGILGLMFLPPLGLYSAWLLFKHRLYKSPVSRNMRWFVYFVIVADVIAISVTLLIVVGLLIATFAELLQNLI